MSVRSARVAGVGAVLVVSLLVEIRLEFAGLPALESPGLFVFVLGMALAIASLHAACIAAPCYLFLIRRAPLRWWNAALAGLLIGAIPTMLLFAVMVGNWAEIVPVAASNGVFGLLGGLTFRALRGLDPRDRKA